MSNYAQELPALAAKYKNDIAPALLKSMGCNPMEVPHLEKIVVNMGVGEASQDKKIAAAVQKDLTAIAGQKALLTKARKSNAGFKIREGWPVGASVTLRGHRMYEFLQRLLSVALPAIRDFRGISSKGFDGRGNYNLGIKENIVFPELEFDTVDKIRGLNITFCTSTSSDERAFELLKAFNFPFRVAQKTEGRAA